MVESARLLSGWPARARRSESCRLRQEDCLSGLKEPLGKRWGAIPRGSESSIFRHDLWCMGEHGCLISSSGRFDSVEVYHVLPCGRAWVS